MKQKLFVIISSILAVAILCALGFGVFSIGGIVKPQAPAKTIPTELTIVFDGKSYTGKYVRTEGLEDGFDYDRNCYQTEDRVYFDVDAKSGKLLFFSNARDDLSISDSADVDRKKENMQKITPEEALPVADRVFNEQCDLSKYRFSGQDYNENFKEYAIGYNRYFGEYPVEWVSIKINEEGKIVCFSAYYDTDNIIMGNKEFDEGKIAKALEKEVTGKEYEIVNKSIIISKNRKPAMSIHIAFADKIKEDKYYVADIYVIELVKGDAYPIRCDEEMALF